MIKLKPQRKTSSSSDSGFTIIESLLGVVVVAILLASISPVLVMSTAMRVQSRRTEKATQAANTFIDGVRIGSIEAPTANKIELDLVTTTNQRTLEENLITLQKMPAPGSATDADLYFVKSDGTICKPFGANDCTKKPDSPFEEFFIQARQIIATDGANDGYRLALRVYRGDVDFSEDLLASDGTNKKTSSVVTAGMGNKQAPAVERTVDISNISTSFGALCQRFGIAKNAAGDNQTCN
ncbi:MULTISPECIES: hormogonium polysaccharide secretion pseudopilin HpsB [Cyanophyceae]|uniref:hormogonium polysaccharide secretion pseudopilin HpsB n=1 Tax=Cyanophyceae TaxID=3028117 RepID=UPI00232BCA6E|nr:MULTISPECIES: hormogonium polysaccharide secretion pseudopilin HpsB [Cyanophyceae]MDB9358171.1 hormogonium polysaccharide secretion pseudopilin HpsB [Nodularia spumigena CS-587/03]MDB9341378.1 hormogonium polysaccharide secretion pseudopilin HpsB [Nodularia spumigena CS-589/07]MDB9402090.1 hormogonium polysaccharide secretion pseudopilin HpsB [Microcystis aeruginosa CS-567/02-A1]MDB9500884.1 hormogonium polysaccharide secretion pseudopilin HpsB [Nodularia spumigena CS-336/02]MDB9532155.1 ho